MADVEAMYHQVSVSPGDRDVLRFLWREDDTQTQEYRMAVHLFGGIWSASCANYALNRTANDNSKDFDTEVVEAVHMNFYVDDFLKSVETREEATKLVDQIPKLLARGGFHLRKWTTNHPQVLSDLPQEDRHDNMQNLDFDGRELSHERVLGVQWDIQDDKLMYKVAISQCRCTRRGVISTVSSIYDPLGMLGPCIIRGKMIFQALCRLKLPWDEEIPEPYLNDWRRWLSEIPQLESFTIRRCVKPVNEARVQSYQLHHFSDASSSGYGAVSYLRMVDEDGNVHCSLLMSKNRLAPLKTLTIPRLELSAAVLSVQLDKILRGSFEFRFEQSVFWTDSTLVLQYVQNETRRFHTFVANRVSAIHDQSTCEQWHHIRSEDNPADAVSRGLLPSQFIPHKLWVTGPCLLYGSDSSWTTPSQVDGLPDTDLEIKQNTHLYVTTMLPDHCMELVEYHSSWDKLKTTIAWLLRLKQCLVSEVKGLRCTFKPYLSTEEMNSAEREIVKLVQRKSYPEELAALKSGRGVKRSSPIYRLEPQLNDEGIICVKGRLRNAPIDLQARHPYIIPGKHHIAMLIIRHMHEASGHSGREHVLAMTRSRFWITDSRTAVNRVLFRCFDCKRRMAAPANQRMGDLPADRVTPFEPPFSYVGTDCFGPFLVKRGRAQIKMYGCIFTCLTTRAIHIEMLHGLDTDSFINGFQRFIARRGHPIRLRSDNGTNFTGAERELKSALAQWNTKQIHDHMKSKNIEWVFNPPAASHMGGSWERQIRTTRKVFTALAQQQVLDIDGLQTLMCITESIINSRPITKLSDDPKDLHPLTPNHLLLLRAGSELPPGVFVPEDAYRRRWRQIQYLANIFWRRWLAEYLPNLQRRQKWLKEKVNIKPGDVVLVVAENCPRSVWPLARVQQVYHGDDGLVRTVKVRTRSSELTRPVHKLCLLKSIDD